MDDPFINPRWKHEGYGTCAAWSFGCSVHQAVEMSNYSVPCPGKVVSKHDNGLQ